MKTNFDENPWKIPQVQIEHFTEEHIERALKAINQLGSGDLYVVDFYSQKIVVDSPSSILLCGYAKDVLKQKQLAFFDLILTKEELL